MKITDKYVLEYYMDAWSKPSDRICNFQFELPKLSDMIKTEINQKFKQTINEYVGYPAMDILRFGSMIKYGSMSRFVPLIDLDDAEETYYFNRRHFRMYLTYTGLIKSDFKTFGITKKKRPGH